MLSRTGRVWTRRLITISAVVCVPAMVAHGQTALPTGAELVARSVTAIGGADAWKALSSVRATGTMELPAQNLRGTFEMVSARPARSVVRVEMGGLGKIETGFNGEVGWTIDPMVGPSLITGAALVEMKNDAHFDAVLHPSDLIASVVTTEKTEFDGRPAFKAVVTYVSGQTRDQYFDAELGFLLGGEGVSDTPMGKVPLKIVMRDYKAFGAVKQPTRLIQSSMGFEQHFVVENVELNNVTPEALAPPAAILAMIKKEPWQDEALASFDLAWTTINNTFYDPAFGGLDWEGVRASLRPKVEAAADPAETRAVIREMLATLKRSHFALMSSEPSKDNPLPRGDALVPIETRMIGDQVVVTSVRAGSDAARAGLTPGVILLAVDDEPTSAWMDTEGGIDPRVAAFATWQQTQRALRGPDRSEARLRVREGDREHTITVPRVRPEGARVVLGDLPPLYVHVADRAVETASGHSAAVVGFNVWMANANPLVEAAIDRHRSKRGLVLDLRGNPGGLAAMIRGVAGHLFTEPVVLGRMKMRDSELEFAANPRIVMPDGRRVEPFAGPVAVLVDELTASASECFAGGLQSLGRARIFGRTTAGQALPASTLRLPNGDLLMHVVGDFVTATGQRPEGDGVIPDVPVALTVEALLAGRDPDLEAALRWLDQAIGD